MKLYLAQHGKAVDKRVDPQRPLSEQGELEVSNVANYLKQSDVEISNIYHSGKARAEQTAEIIADVLGVAEMEQLNGINPNDDIEPIVKTVNLWKSDSMIVSHIPFLPRIIAALLTGNTTTESESLPGNIVCLEKDEQNNWSLAGCCTYSSFSNFASPA